MTQVKKEFCRLSAIKKTLCVFMSMQCLLQGQQEIVCHKATVYLQSLLVIQLHICIKSPRQVEKLTVKPSM